MNEAERQAEALLEALGQELSKSRVAAFEKLDRNVAKKRKRRRRLAGAAAVFCVFLLTVGTLTVTSDAFRGKAFGFFFEEKDGYSDMIREGPEISRQLVVRSPAYIPEGYEKIDEETDETISMLTYENRETGDYLSITQMTDEGMSMSIDNETSTRQRCFVGICEAYYLGGNEIHLLLWDEDGIFYEIASTLDKETLIRIAEGLE